jgi:ABC-type branched-subunit amino acid transport system substrate-binding protein
LSYVNENDMVMLSASSTSPLYNIADDRLFRTCPNDYIQAPAIAEMWKTWGAKGVLFFFRADAWGDGLYNIMTNELADRGIEELGKIRYAGESTEFSSYLANAEIIVQDAIAEFGVDKVGMQLFMFSEDRTMQTQAADYPGLMSIIWMSTESSGRSVRMLNEVEDLAIQTRHFSSLMGVDETNPEYIAFEAEYLERTEETPSFYTATRYDACWLMTKSILETGSIEAENIANVLIPMSWKMYGLSGWMSLNEEGDRIGQVFDIWGFLNDAGNPDTADMREATGTGDLWFQRWGRYTAADIVMEWDDEAIARGGLVRPGAAEFP